MISKKTTEKSAQPATPVGHVWTLFRAASQIDKAITAFAAISSAFKETPASAFDCHLNAGRRLDAARLSQERSYTRRRFRDAKQGANRGPPAMRMRNQRGATVVSGHIIDTDIMDRRVADNY